MAEYTDAELNELVFKAIVPKGLRPETPEEINAMLDSLEAEPQPEETVQRMLRKIRGVRRNRPFWCRMGRHKWSYQGQYGLRRVCLKCPCIQTREWGQRWLLRAMEAENG